jgi:hypothetical protein
VNSEALRPLISRWKSFAVDVVFLTAMQRSIPLRGWHLSHHLPDLSGTERSSATCSGVREIQTRRLSLQRIRHTHEVLDRFIPFGENPRRHSFGCLIAGRTLSRMVDQTYFVTMRPPNQATQQVFAATAEVRGSHLVFVDAQGNVAALFLLDLVASWSVLPTKMPVRGTARSNRGEAGARAVRGQAPLP